MMYARSEDLRAHLRAVFLEAPDAVIAIDATGCVVEWNPAAVRTFGYTRDEAVGRSLASLIVPPQLREAHQLGMARQLATGRSAVLGQRLELPALRRDGIEIPVELAITRLDQSAGTLYVAYLRDISKRVHAEKLRALRLAATQQLAQAGGDSHATLVAVLRTVCEQLRWEYGGFWSMDEAAGGLRSSDTWHADGPALAGFEAGSREIVLPPGRGLPGSVWLERHALWLPDVRESANFPRAALARAAGLRSAFACLVGRHGVLEFLTRHQHQPDDELLETMATVANQLAQYLDNRQAQQLLRESETRFRALMEQAPYSIQIFAPDGTTLDANRAWSELWGVTLDQIAGYNVLQDPQLERTGLLPLLRRAFDGEAVDLPATRYDPNETLPDRTRHSDAVRCVAATAYPLKHEDGRVREVVVVHQDITRRERAEAALRESEQKFRLLADTIPQLAWMAGADGSILWYNRRWYEYTGTTPQQMEGWGWQSVHDPAVLPEVLRRWQASIATGEPFDMVFPIRGADGQFRPFLTRVNPLQDVAGRVLYWFGTNTDVSDIKRMEQALREADRRKDEFLATLAHELRNPLAPVLNALQIVKLRGPSNTDWPRWHEMIDRQVKHLVRLVDDLLDVSRVVRGKIDLHREPVRVDKAVAAAAEMVQPLLLARRHTLVLPGPAEPVWVDADPVRLVQVISNLLTNAAKYTLRDGRIEVCLEVREGQLAIAVEDNGIGIEPAMLDQVFDLFVQGQESEVRAQGGLGIGLTLVKRLVELHGGRVSAASGGRSRGARFEVLLPLAEPRSAVDAGGPPAPEPAAADTGAAEPVVRVLVVDDNRDAADSLAVLLRVRGHEVHVAYDGAAALRLAAGHRPQLVFLDIGMADMDGHETARRMRALPGMAKARLVALTGWGQPQDRQRSMEAGFDDHVVKPIDATAIHGLLQHPGAPSR
jgi:PAS domain S-box-containing protein